MKLKKYILIVIVYIFLLAFLLYNSIKHPNDFNNIFSFFNALITNLSAIFLGAIAIYQSEKYKKESDEKDSTPIIIIASSVDSLNLSTTDIIAHCVPQQAVICDYIICSLNKSVSNFQIEKMVLEESSKIISTYQNFNYSSGLNSTYNGVFLPEVFYKLSVNLPQPRQNSKLYIKFSLKNIYYVKYQKTITLFSNGNGWELIDVSKCTVYC